MLSHITDAVVSRFLDRCQKLPGLLAHEGGPVVLENPTEELVEATQRRRSVKMFMRGNRVASRSIARLEENYLYASRRFPTATNNTIGSGALAVNTYPFFQHAVQGDGVGAGFPSGFVLSLNETNMEVSGQIPQGQSFVFNQIGVSFNADASIADTNQLMEAATLQFAKGGGQFTINHGKLSFWPGGFGQGGGGVAGTTASVASTIFGANGAVDLRAVRNLRIARVIKAQETFAYNFVIPRVGAARDGVAFALGNFVVATIWLWGGWKSAIST